MQKIDRSVETLQVTIPVDTEKQAILDVHSSATWPKDEKIGPQLTRRNVKRIWSLAADKGYDSRESREELREAGVRPLIEHRLVRAVDHAHKTGLYDDRYDQRALVETVKSSVKRSIREVVGARVWYLHC